MKTITKFPNQLGWQGRERGFNTLQETYGNENTAYTLFFYEETKKYEKGYESLNTKKEWIYACKGTLKQLMNELEIYKFNQNEVRVADDHTITFYLKQTSFRESIIRQPEIRIVEGLFYELTSEQFDAIPFPTEPITSKRDIFLSTKLHDSVEVTPDLKTYIQTHFTPIQTNEEKNNQLNYQLIIREDVKHYVPHRIHPDALQLAIQHELTQIEFNFLNYFYESGKALRNGTGQLFFDINDKGIGWSHDRKWVKKQMKRLIKLGLVKHETRHDCRDARYTSWYFYNATQQLDHLKHDF